MFNPYLQEEHTHHAMGIDGARNYPMANNSDGIILDEGSDMAYLKIVDQVGRVTLKPYRMAPVEVKTDADKWDEISSRLDRLEKEILHDKSDS